jgi:transcriptional regulator with GAF, ATPase, and Fis domain
MMAQHEQAPPVWIQNLYLRVELERIQPLLQAKGLKLCSHPSDETLSTIVLFGESTPWDELTGLLEDCRKRNLHTIAAGLHHRPLELSKVWDMLEHGAEDVIAWHSTAQPESVVSERVARWNYIEDKLNSKRIKERLVGESKPWLNLLRQLVEISCFSKAPVLLLGESGTGKELVARLVHDLDNRPNKRDYVILDCSTLVPELSGSEFFGHEKGAFTNAIANRDGAFALANEGTLFLDEIGELPIHLQAELLRVIQEGSYKRVGSNNWRTTNFRLVSATNRKLREEVKQGLFREDLFYRLSTCVCHVPPLRDRRADIPALAAHFVKEVCHPAAPPSFDEPVLQYLLGRDYPGNVRELRQLVARILARHPEKNGLITVGDIPPEDLCSLQLSQHGWHENGFTDAIRQALAHGVGLKDIKRIASDVAMNVAIETACGNLQDAAARLDVSDRLVQGYLAERRR